MTYPTTSRNKKSRPFETHGRSTLADVLDIVLRSMELSETARRDRASALRTIGRLKGCPLTALPCNLASVRTALGQIAPARLRISRGRWTNVKSLVIRSLDLAKVPRLPSRSSQPISEPWLKLLAPLPEYPEKLCFRPFARYCSVEGIAPNAVDQATFERYEQELDQSARAQPRNAYLRLVRTWNRAANAIEGWPEVRVQVTSRRKDYALDWTVFPASFRADVDAMVAATINPDPFSASSPKPIKEVTAKRRAHMLRALASALVHLGYDPKSLDSIAALVEVDRVRTALRFIHDRVGRRKTTHLRNFANQICVVAQHWVGVSDDTLETLKAIRRNVDCGPSGMTAKNRATLRHFDDDRLVDRFLALPDRVWRRQRNLEQLRITDAIDLQIALGIELLTHAPVRLGNLSTIRLDENIIDQGAGRHRRVHLYFPAVDVKNDIDLEFLLPPSAVAMLDRYVAQVRPTLERAPSPYLFPGKGTGHKQGKLLSDQIAAMVEREVGVRLTAHQFRHLAGYIYLKANPGGHEVVRRLLGHKSIETTLRFYAGMEVSAAIRHYDDLVAQRRLEIVRPTRYRSRMSAHA